jgi:predicted nucleotide-binding protein (sugar kinase/HSP70/actin superfamily)
MSARGYYLKGLRNQSKAERTGPTVGIPRALIVYEYAPMLIGFLNELGAKVVLSSKTNNQIMEHSVELSYTDSCFPVKLVHGHAASLVNVDYILYPCAIRMGVKDGDENQKYACPLVQASPFILSEVLGLGKKLLIPIIDLSRGNDDVVKNFTKIAVQMGFSKEQGRKAALAGIAAKREFEEAQAELGRKIMARLKESGKLGVVIFARSYMSQDSGANMGIAEKLAQLGVVPIPLDFLPLDSVNVKEYTDRPYWFNEAKHIAGAHIVARDPMLFGLVLTNFGCGPNSFVLNIVEDIMGSKPLGQLEIDEHAAEAGIVTRLEAFVDTIKGYASSRKAVETLAGNRDIRRFAYSKVNPNRVILVPRMCEGAVALAAAMRAYGVNAVVLPPQDEKNLIYSNKVTSGKECLPYRVTLGDFMKFFYENERYGIDPKEAEGFLASAFGPCRFGKYAIEQVRILRELGFDFPIRTTVSNNGYHDLNLGAGFERLAWRGIVAVDYLEKLLWRTRPYEKTSGAAEKLFDEYLARIADLVSKKEPLDDALRDATAKFKSLIDSDIPRKPLVGINGEIFLRSNKFSNSNLVKECEKAGLEVVVSPIGEWLKYITYRNIEDGVRDRDLKRIITGNIRKYLLEKDERSVICNFAEMIEEEEPTTKELLHYSRQYLSPSVAAKQF